MKRQFEPHRQQNDTADEPRRRGIVLILVVALLGLFAALGISFASLARSEAQGAANFKRSIQQPAAIDRRPLFDNIINQIIYDTTDIYSALRGHSLLRDMYGGPDANRYSKLEYTNRTALAGSLSSNERVFLKRGVFNGTGIPGPRPQNGWELTQLNVLNAMQQLRVPDLIAGSQNVYATAPEFPFNFQVFDPFGAAPFFRPGTAMVPYPAPFAADFPEPEHFIVAGENHFFPFNEDYDAADHNNWLLALIRADGVPIQPSLHRPYLVRELELAGAFGGDAWQAPEGRKILFRPRLRDVDPGVQTGTVLGAWQDLPDHNNDGIRGNIPSELDVDNNGDGIKDSIWVDAGLQPIDIGNGLFVKPLVAIRCQPVDGRVNLNVAGNTGVVFDDPTQANPTEISIDRLLATHVSNYGASPAEINPKWLFKIRTSNFDLPPVWQRTNVANLIEGPIEFERLLYGDSVSRTRGRWTPSADIVSNDLLFGPALPPTPSEVSLQFDGTAVTVPRCWLSRPGRERLHLPTDPAAGASPANDDYTDALLLEPFAQPTAQVKARWAAAPFDMPEAVTMETIVRNNLAPVDFWGMGQVYEPWTIFGANAFGAIGNQPTTLYKSIAPIHVNHVDYGINTLRQDNLIAPGTQPIYQESDLPNENVNWVTTQMRGGYLQGGNPQFLTIDEPGEFSPYNFPGRNDSEALATDIVAHDSPFTPSQFEGVLRGEDLDGSILDTRLTTLLRENILNEPIPAGANQAYLAAWVQRAYARHRLRGLITTESWDLTRFSMPPTTTQLIGSYAEDESALLSVDPTKRHVGHLGQLATGTGQESPIFQPFTRPYDDINGAGDTNPEGNSAQHFLYRLERALAYGQRLDLNRPFRHHYDPNDPAKSQLADQERTAFAEQIYILLWLAVRPTDQSGTNPDPQMCRLLAQLAVNIVDFMDSDNVMTVLKYDLNPTDGWDGNDADLQVIGFELPDLVINEAMAVGLQTMIIDDQNDESPITRAHVWAELRNPWPAVFDRNGVVDETRKMRLQRANGRGSYRLQLYQKTGPAFLDPIESPVIFSDTPEGMNSQPDIPVAQSSPLEIGPDRGDSTGNDGSLWVVGPDLVTTLDHRGVSVPMATELKHTLIGLLDPSDPALEDLNQVGNGFYQTRNMRFDVLPQVPDDTLAVTIEVQRLRNPFMDPDLNRDSVNYNPWITLDSVDLDPGSGSWTFNPENDGSSVVDKAGATLSIERIQPWIGQGQRGWPNALPLLAGWNQFLNYLGVPVIGDESTVTNAGRLTRSGFVQPQGVSQTLTGIGGDRRNSVDANAYASFPFLNRRLASPLELLSVRLYGPMPYDLGGGNPDDFIWKLRFTDDFEIAPHPSNPDSAPGIYRTRLVPWFDGERRFNDQLVHPSGVTNPPLRKIPSLHRFFEFVECHTQFNNAVGEWALGNSAAPDATVAPFDWNFQRRLRVPGKVNINFVTDEEVFQALFDGDEAFPSLPNADAINLANAMGYPLNKFRHLYPDALTAAQDPSRLDSAPSGPGLELSSLVGSGPTFGPINTVMLQELQNPGISYGVMIPPWTMGSGVWLGRHQRYQVTNELFRQIRLSVAGPDGILGTADDVPFRSFASGRLSDTLLRRRDNFNLHGIEGTPRRDPAYPMSSDPLNRNYSGEHYGDATGTGPDGYEATLGHTVPRLFDPIPNPMDKENLFDDSPSNATASWRLEFDRTALNTKFGDPASDPKRVPADYWMLERRRNQILAKIANNVTVRSNVYAVWMTIGFFEVEPGTETAHPPLLRGEYGVAEGRNRRFRAFTLIDRTLADTYNGPGDAKPLDQNEMLLLPGKISIIE